MCCQIPEVTPKSIGSLSHDQQTYSFTCIGHYAFPPVQLTWTKGTFDNTCYYFTNFITLVRLN